MKEGEVEGTKGEEGRDAEGLFFFLEGVVVGGVEGEEVFLYEFVWRGRRRCMSERRDSGRGVSR